MTRIELSLGASAMTLLVWLQPGAALAFCDGPCGPPVGQASSHIFVPPAIAGQQILTASSPITNDWAAPPQPQGDSDTDAAVALPDGGPDGLASLADLDRGAEAWATIEPGALPQPDEFWPGLEKIHLARHARPAPQKTEIAISTSISMAVPATVEHKGVPGIDPMTSGSGNRSLWFAPDDGS
jgi:hypothetical protein